MEKLRMLLNEFVLFWNILNRFYLFLYKAMKRFAGITLLLCLIEFCFNAYKGDDIPTTILWLVLSFANVVILAINISMDKLEKKFK